MGLCMKVKQEQEQQQRLQLMICSSAGDNQAGLLQPASNHTASNHTAWPLPQRGTLIITILSLLTNLPLNSWGLYSVTGTGQSAARVEVRGWRRSTDVGQHPRQWGVLKLKDNTAISSQMQEAWWSAVVFALTPPWPTQAWTCTGVSCWTSCKSSRRTHRYTRTCGDVGHNVGRVELRG